MGTHALPSGRKIHLCSVKIESTYSGHLEGSPETISDFERKHLREQLTRSLPPGRPLVIVPAPPGPLPTWRCVVEMDSPGGVGHEDDQFSTYHSRLVVCWFVDDLAMSVDKMVDSILPHLEWEESAEDYDLMDF